MRPVQSAVGQIPGAAQVQALAPPLGAERAPGSVRRLVPALQDAARLLGQSRVRAAATVLLVQPPALALRSAARAEAIHRFRRRVWPACSRAAE